jgi:hypothetical protein
MQDELEKFFEKNGLGFGGGDIMCRGSSDIQIALAVI